VWVPEVARQTDNFSPIVSPSSRALGQFHTIVRDRKAKTNARLLEINKKKIVARKQLDDTERAIKNGNNEWTRKRSPRSLAGGEREVYRLRNNRLRGRLGHIVSEEESNNLSLAVMKLHDTKRAWKNRKKKAAPRVKDRPVRVRYWICVISPFHSVVKGQVEGFATRSCHGSDDVEVLKS
jgi:hypothetical protein